MCDKAFFSKAKLLIHTSFECDIFDPKYSYKSTLIKHIASVHQKLRPYKCEICGDTFTIRHSLNRHITTVHEENKSFSQRRKTIQM